MNCHLKELCIEITNSCTMECRHCSTCSLRVGAGKPKFIPILVLQSVISQFAKMGGETLEISGGEPLLHPNFFEICIFAKELGLDISLYTSGIIYNYNNNLCGITFEFAKKIKDTGVRKIIFNLEGAQAKTHERIMGVLGTHPIVLESIKNAKSAGLWVGIHFVPMKPNVNELPDVVSLCRRLWVDELAILRFVPQGRGKENRKILELDYHQFQQLLREIIELRKIRSSMKIRAGCPMDFLSLLDSSEKPHNCKAGITTCSIAPNGDVVPCPGFKNTKQFIAGNIYKYSLPQIWDNGFEILRGFSHLDLSGQCENCSSRETCKGRCAAQRLIAHGKINIGPDPCCPKYHTERGKKYVTAGLK
ncbi:MAG: radical SAM protein [Proteobacteria bacterium]|nr:radical SAM protein [Pseudomonadota bacterium]MBU4606862.1 radical SAM protein [Pseudomonadota bacterium]MCG2766455.1 radical SAM protein [Desulfarculaceae bacterium]